jgi:hypothetical protein
MSAKQSVISKEERNLQLIENGVIRTRSGYKKEAIQDIKKEFIFLRVNEFG